jgi:hypothetical protein
MSGDTKTSSFLFRDAEGQCLSVISFVDNDIAYFCMNGAPVPVSEVKQIVSINQAQVGVMVTTASEQRYIIPLTTAALLSHAMPTLMSQ